MKSLIKKFIQKVIYVFVSILNWSKAGRFIQNEIVLNFMKIEKTVEHKGCSLSFITPNMLNYFRAASFSIKEPETLEWIDSIPTGSVVWDIGANVGLYSVYAAKQRNCRVFSFEPSVFNLELLARNIFVNGLVDKVTIVPLPLSDELRTSSLNMTSTDWGGALSTFDQSYGHDGKEIQKTFEFNTVGLSMADAVKRLQIPAPEYIKMDVDGIEHLILKGGDCILRNIRGILVEVNDDYKEQDAKVKMYLTAAGLVLKDKKHASMFDGNDIFGNSYNQIWCRPEL